MNVQTYVSLRDELVKIAAVSPDTWKHLGELGTHAAEVGGLGVLARPTIQKMRGKEVSEKSEHAHELAGLGILAVPSAIHLGHMAKSGYKAIKAMKKVSSANLVDGALSLFNKEANYELGSTMGQSWNPAAAAGHAPLKSLSKAEILAKARARPKGLAAVSGSATKMIGRAAQGL